MNTQWVSIIMFEYDGSYYFQRKLTDGEFEATVVTGISALT